MLHTCKVIGLCVVLLIAFSNLSNAQANFWQDINGIRPGWSLYATRGGRIIVGPDSSGMYVSDDDGLSFTSTGLKTGTCYEISGRSNKVIAGWTDFIFGHILLTTDNGINWTIPYRTPLRNPSIDLEYVRLSDSGEVFSFSYTSPPKLVRFENNLWKTVDSTLPIRSAFAFEIDHTNTFYVGTSRSGLYMSRSYGAPWIQKIPSNWVGTLSVTESNAILAGAHGFSWTPSDGGVFLSSDTGKTWKNLGLTRRGIRKIVVDSTGTPFVGTSEYSGYWGGGVYRYNQSDSQWIRSPLPDEEYANVVISSRGSLLAYGSESGIFRSTDGGITWLQNAPRKRSISSILAHDTSSIIIGTLDNGVFTTTDGGSSWIHSQDQVFANIIYSLNLHDDKIYAVTDQGIFRSDNLGDTWFKVSDTDITGSVYSLSANQSNQLFAATDFGVYSSIDGDSVWVQMGLADYKVRFLARGNSNELYACTERDGIFLSWDNGFTWESIGLIRSDINTIVINNSGNLFAGVYGGLYRSTDYGTTWEEKIIDTAYTSSLLFRGNQTIVAGTHIGIYISYNNGESWTRLNSNGLSQPFVLSLAEDKKGNLLAGTYKGGLFRTTQPLTTVESISEVPRFTRLYQNYPNPFNPSTLIRYDIPNAENVSLRIFNLLGQLVQVVVNGWQTAGQHSVEFRTNTLPSGIYIYQLSTTKFTEAKKMLLLR